MALRALAACSSDSPGGGASSVSESAALIGSASDGVRSSARATAASSIDPPQSSTRVNAQIFPAETDGGARNLVLAEERLQRRGERLGLAQLAADDDAWVERSSSELDDLRAIAVDDAGRGELRGADLQPHELLVHARARLLHLAG